MATASNGITVSGMFWMLTVSRGVVGFGAGGMSTLSPDHNNFEISMLSQENTPLLQHQLRKLQTNAA